MLAFDPVFRSHRHHAPRGKVLALAVKLVGSAVDPAASEEKDDGGTGFIRFAFGWIKYMQLKVAGIYLFVGDFGVRFGSVKSCSKSEGRGKQGEASFKRCLHED